MNEEKANDKCPKRCPEFIDQRTLLDEQNQEIKRKNSIIKMFLESYISSLDEKGNVDGWGWHIGDLDKAVEAAKKESKGE